MVIAESYAPFCPLCALWVIGGALSRLTQSGVCLTMQERAEKAKQEREALAKAKQEALEKEKQAQLDAELAAYKAKAAAADAAKA